MHPHYGRWGQEMWAYGNDTIPCLNCHTEHFFLLYASRNEFSWSDWTINILTCVFYWWGCKLLWYCQMIETVEGRISLLEHNHWSWALEECIISSDPRFLAPCHWFPAGKMWTVFCHHTLLAMVFCLLESKTVISSTHDYELKSAKLLVKTYTSSFLVAFLIFYCSDRKMTHAEGERSEDRFFLPYEWYSKKKKCIQFLCLFLLTI